MHACNRDKHIGRPTDRWTDRYADRQTKRWPYIYPDRCSYRNADPVTDGHTERHTVTHPIYCHFVTVLNQNEMTTFTPVQPIDVSWIGDSANHIVEYVEFL